MTQFKSCDLAAPDKFEVKYSERAVTALTAHLDLNFLISAQTFQPGLFIKLKKQSEKVCWEAKRA